MWTIYTWGLLRRSEGQQAPSPGGRRVPPLQARGSASLLVPCSRSCPRCPLHTPGLVPLLLPSRMPAPPSTPGRLSFYTQLRHHLPPGRLGLCWPSDPCVDPMCILFTFPRNIHPGSSSTQGVCPSSTPEPSTKPGPSHHPQCSLLFVLN